ncbi:serine/threonine protein kinase [Corallococcus sp. H22C18031201]|nr:serine/threonine protein kinase [Corallococcus sp. H22C18031201]
MPIHICQRCEAQHDTWNGACPACGGTHLLTLAPTEDRMLGRVVAGRYRILRRLGQGGMGSVYLAEQVGIGQQVALKFLNSGLSMDPDVARRFLNEAKSYARVAHPNAVMLHDFGQDEEGGLYISMEYVEGDDLKRVLHAAGRRPPHEAGDIMLQVADVLAYAHARQVIHRDLKPENIMVRQGLRGFHVKVLDFGIARIADGAPRLTVQGAVAGTPRYMAPEQVLGLDADARADVYAVGIVLFEMLTGRQPFDGTTIPEIMQKQVHQPMPRLAELCPDLQLPALDAVIQKATAKNRVERYATMEAFASDLSNALPTLTGRSALSLTPVPGGAPGAPQTPGTLLYGDGTEATLIRGATPAAAMPAVPIQLTQPAPGATPTSAPSGARAPSATGTTPDAARKAGPPSLGQPAQGATPTSAMPISRPMSDGLDKTALPASPYAPPANRRGGLLSAIVVGGIMMAAGLGIVHLRTMSPEGPSTQVAARPALDPAAGTAPAPGAATADGTSAPTREPHEEGAARPAPGTEPATAAPTTVGAEAATGATPHGRTVTPSTDTVPAITAPTGGPGADSAPSTADAVPRPSGPATPDEQRQARELLFRANLELATGKLGDAQAILDSAPELAAAEPRLEELRTNVSKATALMNRGNTQARDGACESAIRTYREVLKLFPKARDAQSAIARCRADLPPEIAP